jgi:CysZ protein
MTNTALRLRLSDGLKAIFIAFRVLCRRPRILRWLVPPFLITILLDGLAFYFSYGWLRAGIGSLVSGDGSMGWLRAALDVIGGVAVLFILGWSFAWLFLTLTSPFQDFISAEVEQELTGDVGPEPPGLSGFFRSIAQSLIQAIVFSLLTGAFLVIGLVPLVGPLLFFVWTAFALGYSFVAIPSGRMAHRFSMRVSFARRHRGAVFGLGMAVAGATLMPLVNVLLMPLFVVAGTVLYVEAEKSAPDGQRHLGSRI